MIKSNPTQFKFNLIQCPRKPFLYFCMTGSLVSSALNLANAFFLDEWSR